MRTMSTIFWLIIGLVAIVATYILLHDPDWIVVPRR